MLLYNIIAPIQTSDVNEFLKQYFNKYNIIISNRKKRNLLQLTCPEEATYYDFQRTLSTSNEKKVWYYFKYLFQF